MASPRRRWPAGFLFVLLLGLATARSASADPIQVTSGFLTINWDGCCAGFSLQGTGFSMGVVDNFHTSHSYGTLAAGTTANLDFNMTPGGRGSAQVNGVSIQNPDDIVGGGSLSWFGGNLSFDLDPFAVEDGDPSATFVNFSTPFRMSGTLLGYRTFDRTGAPLFEVSLFGQGTVNLVNLRRFEDDGRVTFSSHLANSNFTFTAAEVAAPTPEPATLLLLGTGAGLVALRARRRRDQT